MMLKTLLTSALCALTLLAADAQARCTGKDRVSVFRSDCASAWHGRNLWRSALGAQNLCPKLGTVVIKWDLKSHKDQTWWLKTGKKRRTKTAAKVRGMYCCKDLGICDRADAYK